MPTLNVSFDMGKLGKFSEFKYSKTIQIIGDETIYSFPTTEQIISLHPKLAKHSSIEQTLKQLDKRGKIRKIKITLA